jgi:hypothetical protein
MRDDLFFVVVVVVVVVVVFVDLIWLFHWVLNIDGALLKGRHIDVAVTMIKIACYFQIHLNIYYFKYISKMRDDYPFCCYCGIYCHHCLSFYISIPTVITQRSWIVGACTCSSNFISGAIYFRKFQENNNLV